MRLEWTDEAQDDLHRVHYFLVWKSPRAAASAVEALILAPNRLLDQPHVGSFVDSMAESEVRRILVGQYEVRYDTVGDVIRVLRIFHMREER